VAGGLPDWLGAPTSTPGAPQTSTLRNWFGDKPLALSGWLNSHVPLPGVLLDDDGKPLESVASVLLQTLYFVPGLLIGSLLGWFIIRPVNAALAWFFRIFNRCFDDLIAGYGWGVGRMLRLMVIVLVLYVGLLGLTYVAINQTPSGFVPQQDKGYLLLQVELPSSASLQRTEAAMARIDTLVRGDIKDPDNPVESTVGISGQSLILSANAPNLGSLYVMLKPFGERPKKSAEQIGKALEDLCHSQVPGAKVQAFGAPPIDGLGTTGGFKMIVEDRGNTGPEQLALACDDFVAEGNPAEGEGAPWLSNPSRADTPWLRLDIDRAKCMALGVQVSDVFNALQVYLGSYCVNNFNVFGRTWQVNVQADNRFRGDTPAIEGLQVRNNQNQMVRLGALLEVHDYYGPVMVLRYNMYSAAAVIGDPPRGMSSGEAMDEMRKLSDKLPSSMAAEWTELAYLQEKAGNQAMWFFGLAVVFVFLVLAAQYESWKLPIAVILVVPMCLLCSVIGLRLAGMEVNLFTQIGFVVLVGLASKNAILIVEFAKQQQEAGSSRWEATVQACRLRLRPIVMTSFAFILGVVPLVRAEGAGAEMRQALGLAVFSGMLGVTLFGIFLTPVFYFFLQGLGTKRGPSAAAPKLEAPAKGPHDVPAKDLH
jgi:multidrug efflux pump